MLGRRGLLVALETWTTLRGAVGSRPCTCDNLAQNYTHTHTHTGPQQQNKVGGQYPRPHSACDTDHTSTKCYRWVKQSEGYVDFL